MKLIFINDFEQLQKYRNNWDAVASPFPFFRWNWLSNWIRHMGQNLKLAVLAGVNEQGKWVGVAPFCVDDSSPFATKLRLLGSGAVCSDYLDLICDTDVYPKFSEMTVDWIVNNIGNPATLGRIDVIELEGITTTNRRTQYLCDLFEASGLRSHTTELEGGWTVDLPTSWEELNSNFSKSMRRKTKKAQQRMASDASEVITSVDRPFEELWKIFKDLHQQRRMMLGQPGCFANQDFELFLDSAIRSLIEESTAELIFIYLEGRPLASMLLLNDDDAVYMYQSGLDTQRMKLEPGYQIGFCAIQRSIEKGFKHFDFLRGDEPYKSRWNTTRIPISRTRFIPHNTIARLKHGLWLTGRSLKTRINQVDSWPADAN